MIDERITRAKEELKNEISTSREEIEKANLKVFDSYLMAVREAYQVHQENNLRQGEILISYLENIRDLYPKMQPPQRKKMCVDLEKLVGQWRGFDPLAKLAKAVENPFDAKKARLARQEAHLSLRELAGKLGVTSQLIYSYETGRAPLKIPRSRKSQDYFSWLKKQGYNPYNL